MCHYYPHSHSHAHTRAVHTAAGAWPWMSAFILDSIGMGPQDPRRSLRILPLFISIATLVCQYLSSLEAKIFTLCDISSLWNKFFMRYYDIWKYLKVEKQMEINIRRQLYSCLFRIIRVMWWKNKGVAFWSHIVCYPFEKVDRSHNLNFVWLADQSLNHCYWFPRITSLNYITQERRLPFSVISDQSAVGQCLEGCLHTN